MGEVCVLFVILLYAPGASGAQSDAAALSSNHLIVSTWTVHHGNWRTWIEKAVWVDFVGSTDWVDFSPPGFGVGELKNWLGGFFTPTDYLGGVASVDSET